MSSRLASSETGGAWGRPEHRPPHKAGPVGCCTGRGGVVVAGGTSDSRLAHAAEAPDVTGCRGLSYSGHFPGQPVVVRVPPPHSGMEATARHHRASPQGAELTARDITFSWLRRRAPAARYGGEAEEPAPVPVGRATGHQTQRSRGQVAPPRTPPPPLDPGDERRRYNTPQLVGKWIGFRIKKQKPLVGPGSRRKTAHFLRLRTPAWCCFRVRPHALLASGTGFTARPW
jgi:hypothetical protein